jgi:hypothetical protein
LKKKIILKIIKEYNRFRSPEATAEFIKKEDKKILINFSGPFCESCGVTDYFEDFVIEANNNELKLNIRDIVQIDFNNYLVEFGEEIQ